MITPAGVPRPVAEAFNRALVSSLAAHDLWEKMLFAGHDLPQGPNTLEDARAFMARELATFVEVVQRTGVRLRP